MNCMKASHASRATWATSLPSALILPSSSSTSAFRSSYGLLGVLGDLVTLVRDVGLELLGLLTHVGHAGLDVVARVVEAVVQVVAGLLQLSHGVVHVVLRLADGIVDLLLGLVGRSLALSCAVSTESEEQAASPEPNNRTDATERSARAECVHVSNLSMEVGDPWPTGSQPTEGWGPTPCRRPCPFPVRTGLNPARPVVLAGQLRSRA